MMTLAQGPKPKAETVVTSIALPLPLWQAIKRRAAEDRSDLRAVCLAALHAYLGLEAPPAAPRKRGK